MHHDVANASANDRANVGTAKVWSPGTKEVNDDISIDREHNYTGLAAISAALWGKSGAPNVHHRPALGILDSRC